MLRRKPPPGIALPVGTPNLLCQLGVGLLDVPKRMFDPHYYVRRIRRRSAPGQHHLANARVPAEVAAREVVLAERLVRSAPIA